MPPFRSFLKAFVTALALASCAGLPAPAAAPLAGRAEQFGRWTAGCSNLGQCQAIAVLEEGAENPAYLVMIFGPRIAEPQSVAVMRDGQMIDSLSPLAAQEVWLGLQSAEAVTQDLVLEGGQRFAVPAAGFAELMAVLAAWRRSAGRQDLRQVPLIPRPAQRIDHPPLRPVLAEAAANCPEGHFGESLQAWDMSGGKVMWRVGCGDEGLNPTSFWFLAAGPDGEPQPISFGPLSGATGLPNAWFDPATGYLRMLNYFGGHQIYRFEDCGIYRAFAWDGAAMVLAEQREMPACQSGIGPHGWITTHSAAFRNDPVSGPR